LLEVFMRAGLTVRGVILALAAASLGACAVVQEKTVGESFDEASAGTEIKTRLFANGGFSRFGEVDVEVADRLVLLSGRVPSEADRMEAERIAWTVASIDEVANELVVDARSLGRDVNDRWITEQVRARLIANSDVKGLNYNIQVYDGSVFLLGLAQTEDELRTAAEAASRVKGVKRVVSYVKMRERAVPPALQAGIPASRPQEAVEIAPDAEAPAPIVPERQPTQRGGYSDPYAPGSLLPPGAGSNSSGLQSSPLTPLQ
jgi:osmotically-inducible protein OsmY